MKSRKAGQHARLFCNASRRWNSVCLFLLFAGTPFFLLLRHTQRGVEHAAHIHDALTGAQTFEHGLVNLELFVAELGRLDAQANAALHRINFDHACFHFLTGLEHILDLLDTLLADLADVHEAVNAFLDFDKRTERGQFADLALDTLANLVLGRNR